MNRLAQIEALPIVPMFVKVTQRYSYIVEYKAVVLNSVFFAQIAKEIQADKQPYNSDITFNVI